MNRSVKTKDLYNCNIDFLTPLFLESEYPWQIIPKIKEYIYEIFRKEIVGYKKVGNDVLIGENVKIYPTATIEGPTVIGRDTEIRPGAFIRGGVIIGRGCVIGNSSELKNCILLDSVQIPHYNYVGDSVLGNKSHTGAGTICSNLRSDGKNVVVHAEVDYPTGQRKLGAFLGDGADVGCGSVLNPGTVVGMNTAVYPLTSLRGVYPSNSIVKDTKTVVKKNSDLHAN